MYFMNLTDTVNGKSLNMIPIIGSIVAAIVLLAIIVLIVSSKKKKNKKKGFINVNEEFVDKLIGYYGGIENIKDVTVDNARLKIEVVDLEKVDLESIRDNSNGGLFVKFNTIKTLYKLDSAAIKHLIDVKR